MRLEVGSSSKWCKGQARLDLLFTAAYVLMVAAVYLLDHRYLDRADELSRAGAVGSTVEG